MLEFNPFKRKSAKECLEHPIFKSIRDKSLEFEASFKIKVHDQDSKGFDYEEYIEKLSMESCKEALLDELKMCQKFM